MVTIDWNGLLLPLAEVCTTDGKISFGDKTPWQHFEARRKDVLEIWPERAEKLTSVAEKRCEKWLRELAEQEPKAAAITQHGGKEYWQPLARGKFKGLSERAFERAWATVARDHEEMSKSGPKTRN